LGNRRRVGDRRGGRNHQHCERDVFDVHRLLERGAN
jgi:hypothetical protein